MDEAEREREASMTQEQKQAKHAKKEIDKDKRDIDDWTTWVSEVTGDPVTLYKHGLSDNALWVKPDDSKICKGNDNPDIVVRCSHADC